MKKLFKLILGLLVFVFAAYWMLQDPNRLATVTKDVSSLVWDMVTNFFDGLIAYVNALLA